MQEKHRRNGGGYPFPIPLPLSSAWVGSQQFLSSTCDSSSGLGDHRYNLWQFTSNRVFGHYCGELDPFISDLCESVEPFYERPEMKSSKKFSRGSLGGSAV